MGLFQQAASLESIFLLSRDRYAEGSFQLGAAADFPERLLDGSVADDFFSRHEPRKFTGLQHFVGGSLYRGGSDSAVNRYSPTFDPVGRGDNRNYAALVFIVGIRSSKSFLEIPDISKL